MVIRLKFKNLLTVVFLSGFCGFAVAATEKIVEENNDLAPEVTAAEAKLSFWDMPFLKKAYINSSPVDRKDGIAVGKLGVDGGNKDKIVKFAEEIADSKFGEYDSLLIAHKDKLLFESYYQRARINLAHFQMSAVKAYTSLALGRAIQLGYLTMADLHKPLVSFLKDLDSTKFVEGAEKITLHKALTMHGRTAHLPGVLFQRHSSSPKPRRGPGIQPLAPQRHAELRPVGPDAFVWRLQVDGFPDRCAV